MLTSSESIIVYSGGYAYPDCLRRNEHRGYTSLAGQMLQIYIDGTGKTRKQLHQEARELFSNMERCPERRICAMIKLLDSEGTFTFPDNVIRRRMDILLGSDHREDLNLDVSELFADRPEFQRLSHFEGYESPVAFLSRYNVSQLQAAMYRCRKMQITLKSGFKRVIRHINLSRLLHSISPIKSGGYRIVLSGPLSHLHKTTRYGCALSRFVPALLTCDNWQMSAVLSGPWNTEATMNLSSDDGYNSYMEPDIEFDSKVEEEFATAFNTCHRGWELIREGRLLHDGQKVFIPDFILRNGSGTEILLEIAGYWTPEYLREKIRTLELFRRPELFVAVPAGSPAIDALPAENTIIYSGNIDPNAVVDAIEKNGIISSDC